MPQKYKKLTEDYSLRRCALYFLTLLILVSLVTGLLYIPSLLEAPEQIQKEFSKLNNITFNVELDTEGEAKFGFLTVDMNTNKSLDRTGILIANQRLEYKLIPFTSPKVISDKDFEEVVNNPGSIESLVGLVVLFIAPYLLLLLFLYHLVKYLIIILLVSSLIIMLIRTSKGDINGKPVYKAGFFAAFLLMLELPLQVFVDSWMVHSLIPFLLFLIFFLIIIFYLRPEEIIEKKEKKDDFVEDYVEGDVFADANFGQ